MGLISSGALFSKQGHGAACKAACIGGPVGGSQHLDCLPADSLGGREDGGVHVRLREPGVLQAPVEQAQAAHEAQAHLQEILYRRMGSGVSSLTCLETGGCILHADRHACACVHALILMCLLQNSPCEQGVLTQTSTPASPANLQRPLGPRSQGICRVLDDADQGRWCQASRIKAGIQDDDSLRRGAPPASCRSDWRCSCTWGLSAGLTCGC